VRLPSLSAGRLSDAAPSGPGADKPVGQSPAPLFEWVHPHSNRPASLVSGTGVWLIGISYRGAWDGWG
jgi:hypothetical protein